MAFRGVQWIAALAIVLSVAGCGGAGGGGSDAGGGGDGAEEAANLSGVVYDAVSGEPIPGAQVRFGETAAESNAGGAFEIALDDSSTTVSEAFSVLAEGYAFLLVDELDVATTNAVSITLPLPRRDPGSYTGGRTIEGQVYDEAGDEITDGNVAVTVYGANGTVESFDSQAYSNSYSVETAVRSSDALVVIEIIDASVEGSPRPDFAYYRQGVDLSAAGSTTADVLRPPAGEYYFATLSNADAGDVASAYWVTPYGGVPCHFVPATEGELEPGEDTRSELTFDTASPVHVALYNPAGWDRLVLLRSRTDASGERR